MGLTFLRLLLLPVFLYALLADPTESAFAGRRTAFAIFAVMALTDKLDGYLARKLNQVSRLGTILDPVADKLLITCSVFILAIERIAPPSFAIPWQVVAIIYCKDVVTVLGIVAIAAKIGSATIRPRWLGKGATFLQLVLVLATLLAPELAGISSPGAVHATMQGLYWLVGGVSVAAVLDYVFVGVQAVRKTTAPGGVSPEEPRGPTIR